MCSNHIGTVQAGLFFFLGIVDHFDPMSPIRTPKYFIHLVDLASRRTSAYPPRRGPLLLCMKNFLFKIFNIEFSHSKKMAEDRGYSTEWELFLISSFVSSRILIFRELSPVSSDLSFLLHRGFRPLRSLVLSRSPRSGRLSRFNDPKISTVEGWSQPVRPVAPR